MPTAEATRLDDLRRQAATHGCELVRRHDLRILERARAYESQKRAEAEDEVLRLRAALEDRLGR